MYKQVKMKSEYAIDVKQYHSARYGAPGQKRGKKTKPTPVQMEKINQKKKEERILWRIRTYFKKDDLFVTLTYRKDERPKDMDEAKEDYKKFIDAVRKGYKKMGEECRWMRNIEVGTKNAWHIHLIINRIPDAEVLIRKAWKKGKAQMQLLYPGECEFKKLAQYIAKSEKTEKRIREANFSSSRNMPLPEPEIKIYHWRTWRKIKIPEGWILDKGSFYEGINPITGYPYRHYTLLKVRRE